MVLYLLACSTMGLQMDRDFLFFLMDRILKDGSRIISPHARMELISVVPIRTMENLETIFFMEWGRKLDRLIFFKEIIRMD